MTIATAFLGISKIPTVNVAFHAFSYLSTIFCFAVTQIYATESWIKGKN